MKPKLTIIAMTIPLCLLFAAAQAQTTTTITQSDASAVFDSITSSVGVSYSSQFCDLTCTTVNYTFCIQETPGCLEGYMEVADTAFKGYVGTSYTASNTVVLNATITSGDQYGTSYYCYAWNSEAECTDEVDVVAPNCTAASCPTEVGTVSVTFTKIPNAATLENSISTSVNGGVGGATNGDGEKLTTQTITDYFDDTASGTVIGVGFDQADVDANQCCMYFAETISSSAAAAATAAAMVPSKVLNGRLPEKLLARFRALEKVKASAIAARDAQITR